MASMKHVGVNVAADPLYTISYGGVNGGLVLVAADDPGLYSSQNEQDTRCVARAAMVPVLEPSDSQEAKDFVKLAFELSEKFDTPVFIRLSTRVSHSQSLVELCDRENVEVKPYEKNIGKYVMMPANAIKRHVVVEDRIAALKDFAETSELNAVENNGSKIGVISAGIAYVYAKEALGEKVDYLKLGMVYPLPDNKLKEFAAAHDVVYVI
jgi:indolepyruvate ferredoxin oxidoreductase alpha subunit